MFDIVDIHKRTLKCLHSDFYLTASTYLASRAFPSSILSPNPTLVASPSSYPILLPGIDTLNHARGQPVTWLVSYPNKTPAASVREPSVSLVLHAPTQTGEELFNNYGPKPNSELILAYGFTLPDNPDDTIVLRIGGQGGTGKKWEVGRDARGFDAVWEEVHTIFSSQGGDEDAEPFANDLDTANMLLDMLGTLFERLPDDNNFTNEIRPDVQTMISRYIEGNILLDSPRIVLNHKLNLTRSAKYPQSSLAVLRKEETECSKCRQ